MENVRKLLSSIHTGGNKTEKYLKQLTWTTGNNLEFNKNLLWKVDIAEF